MKIAVLSGKGGAGKTLLATNLAAALYDSVYVDCDVEEPNGRLFFDINSTKEVPVEIPLPVFAADECIGCKKCVEFCRFNALIYIKKKPMVFSEVCHSCGGCKIVCPTGAITESPHAIGHLELAKTTIPAASNEAKELRLITGVLNPGEASGVPVIKAAESTAFSIKAEHTIIDCPPGSACPVLESVEAADFCLLVTEPTSFGLHNLQMVHELATLLGKPCGLVINKEQTVYPPLEKYCQKSGLPILQRIPFTLELAETIAQGKLAYIHNKNIAKLIDDLAFKICSKGGQINEKASYIKR